MKHILSEEVIKGYYDCKDADEATRYAIENELTVDQVLDAALHYGFLKVDDDGEIVAGDYYDKEVH